jgi:transcriptional regulator with XRE-family HTH domain
VKKDILKGFGERVRELREKKEWTQEDLADKTSFHRTYIGMIERGERNPSLKNMKKFADAFGLNLSELMKF